MDYEQKIESILFSLVEEVSSLSKMVEPCEDQIQKYHYLIEEISLLNTDIKDNCNKTHPKH